MGCEGRKHLSLDKVTGALLGTFIGDALGMPVEGWSTEKISQKYGEVREMLSARLGQARIRTIRS